MTTMTTTEVGTTYEIVRGDADDIVVSVVNDAKPAAAIDLSAATDNTPARPAVLRFTVRKKPDVVAAVFAKTSFSANDIEVLAQSGSTKGKAVVYIDHPDTTQKIGKYVWDLEITRQSRLRTSAGSVAVTAGGVDVVGAGTSFLLAKPGDVLHFTSGPNSGKAFLIETITTNLALVLSATTAVLLDATASFEIRRGFRRTPLRGFFNIVEEVTR